MGYLQFQLMALLIEMTVFKPKMLQKLFRSKSTKLITVTPTNVGSEYYVDLGTYEGVVPSLIDSAVLSLSEYKVDIMKEGCFKPISCRCIYCEGGCRIGKRRI